MTEQPQPAWSSAVMWFRRDLRVADNPALTEAATRARTVVPLFVLDERLMRTGAPARRWFLERSLAELDASLRARGSALVVRTGPAHVVVPEVARAVGADVVLAARDVTPYSHRRDRRVAAALEDEGRRLALRPGALLSEPESMLTSAGRPYGVFTPFWRSLQKADRRELARAPEHVPAPRDTIDGDLQAADWAQRRAPVEGLPRPGEAAALERLDAWVADGLAGYGTTRDDLSGSGSSHLGADLHLGTLSPRQVEEAASALGERAEPFVRQLGWRDFYHHLLFHRRDDETWAADPLQSAFQQESDDPEAVAAWREGRTGVPAVDAAMRQLLATAWMSNRARMIVASYLTRHLLMDWRIGERHFMQHLVDGDVANNRGGWMWTAGVGADPQPWFRIFNPVLQGKRYDPEGAWVRRWVPELERVPDRYVHEPWAMPLATQEQTGVVIGDSYPEPIVGLKEGRARALAAFRAATDAAKAASEG